MLQVKYIQYGIQICQMQWKFNCKACVRLRRVFHERTNSKVKFNTRTGTEDPEGKWWYASTLHLIPKVLCQQLKSLYGNLKPWIHPLTIVQEVAGHQSRSRRVRNILLPPGVDSKTDQPVVSRYTAPPTPCEEDLKLKYHWK